MLGLQSTGGVIIDNAVVLIERIGLERQAGSAPLEAVVTPSLQRLRPLPHHGHHDPGLTPLIVFGGELRFAMAIVIASGFGLATVLALGVVPALTTLFFLLPHADPPPGGRGR